MNVLHIESRKSRKLDSAYDIYVDVEKGTTDKDDIISKLAEKVEGILSQGSLQSPLERKGRVYLIGWVFY